MDDDVVVIRKPKTVPFNFDLPKDDDKNLKQVIEFNIKHNESFAGHKNNEIFFYT